MPHVIDSFSLDLLILLFASTKHIETGKPPLVGSHLVASLIDFDSLSEPIEEGNPPPHLPFFFFDAILCPLINMGTYSGLGLVLLLFDVGFFSVFEVGIYQPAILASSSLSMSCPFVVKGHISEIGCVSSCLALAPSLLPHQVNGSSSDGEWRTREKVNNIKEN